MPIRLRRVTVRFSPPSHEMVEEAAQVEGVTFAQYVREAALMRAAYQLGLDAGAKTDVDAYTRGIAMIRARWEQYGDLVDGE